jgi:thioredoxin-like negative regulator of GroEL
VEKAVAATKGNVALVKVNIDDAGKLADKQGIEYVPTIRLHRHGCPISQLETKPTLNVLLEWIKEYLALMPARTRKK